MHGRNLAAAIGFVLLAGAWPSAGCEGGNSGSSLGPSAGGSSNVGVNVGGGSTASFNPTEGGQAACEGLECDVPSCPGSMDGTTITGTAFAPNGTLPLYNVVAYIQKFPELPLEPITTGATCEQCPTSIANAVRTALSDATGVFKLTNVPAGANIPIVLQIGKWRRRVVLPSVQPCVDNPLPTTNPNDPLLTRLPRDKSEGDIPQMNIVTGGCDPLPCLFRKMGLADGEFTDSSQNGRMHVYRGVGGANVDAGNALQPEVALWASQAQLMPYDITILSCECSEYNQFKTPQMMGFMRDYLNAGGRAFATHYHYTWFKNGPAEFQALASWVSPGSTNPYTIDTSFPKGAAFATWLQTVGQSVTGNTINLTSIREDVGTVNAGAQRWIYQPSPESVKYFTFNTPVGIAPEMQCGRGVFSDIHVSEGGVSGNVPSGCDTAALTDQEKALIFLFFDLAACFDPDGGPPQPPAPE